MKIDRGEGRMERETEIERSEKSRRGEGLGKRGREGLGGIGRERDR
jgi:hypothetical protein